VAERDPFEGACLCVRVYVCIESVRMCVCVYVRFVAARVRLEFGNVFCEWLREIPLKVCMFVCVCMYRNIHTHTHMYTYAGVFIHVWCGS
jgi:hypothetical protein